MNEEKVNSQIKVDDTLYQTQLTKKFLNRQKYVPRDPLLLTTQIPGVVKSIFVKEGDRVKQGQSVMILEAMKMLNNIQSPVEGVVKKIFADVGQQVPKDSKLIQFSE